MDCNFGTCKKRSEEQYTCDNCYIPKYCSTVCKQKDRESHSQYCSPRTFVLKDFIPVKTSRKILDIGTYGEVQLMQNQTNNKLYAMKVIRKNLANEVIPLKVFFREIMIHKTLVHPNIVRLIDHFEDSTRLYIILEFVEKGNLFDLIRRKIKLSESEACEILIQTCSGLNYLHEKEIIHRDLKPENLLISKEEVIKISDFGWSAQGSDKKGTFCGTLDYLSPEMINSEPHTTKLDVWSIGILLYEMLHGAPPYRAKNPKEQYRLISAGTYTIGSHVSKSAAALIRSILQLRPEARPTVLDILRSQWVQEYSESKLNRDWRVRDPKQGEGLIMNVTGKVALVNFRGSRVPMTETDVFSKCTVLDANNKLIWTPDQTDGLIPRLEEDRNVNVGSLYKKLGIDSGRATPISGRATPTGNRPGSGTFARSDSRRMSGTAVGAVTASKSTNPARNTIEVSPPLTDRPPRNREEEYKRHEVARKDYRDIDIRPEAVSPTSARSKPKSSFLNRFKAK